MMHDLLLLYMVENFVLCYYNLLVTVQSDMWFATYIVPTLVCVFGFVLGVIQPLSSS